MPDRINLEVVTPERMWVHEEVDEVLIPGSEGDFGVLPGHCEFLALLRPGEIRYQTGQRIQSISVGGGFAEVRENHVTLLADQSGRSAEEGTRLPEEGGHA